LLIKENQISEVKKFSAFLYVGRCETLGSLKLFLSYASQPGADGCRCHFFTHPTPTPTPTPLLSAFRAQKFTFGRPESTMAVTSLFIDMAGNTPFHISHIGSLSKMLLEGPHLILLQYKFRRNLFQCRL